MNKVNGVAQCYDAFARLKDNCPRNEKFTGLPHDKITAAIVSQEAGFDSGYLKRSRPAHQAILALIDSFKKEKLSTTLSKSEIQKRERNVARRYKDECDRLQLLLEESLSRELLLAAKLKQLETLLYNSGKLYSVINK